VTLAFPDGRKFAFTIMDDTDVGTVENLGPIYRLLDELGMRTTKTVWSFGHGGGETPFAETDTLEDGRFVEFVRWLHSRGFEIAYHGASMESSARERTVRSFRRYKELFGAAPRVYANHAYNRENLYWGVDRIDDPFLKVVYAGTGERPPGFYQGHLAESPFWWGDMAAEIAYVRNLTFADINTLRWNPSMPYRDVRRPGVQRWFSASDADGAAEFNALIAPEAQDRLEREGGVCIVATHLGKRYTQDDKVDATTERLLRRLASRDGWFVPVGELLDWLAGQREGSADLPPGEWRVMQWRWAWDLLARNVQRRLAKRTISGRRAPSTAERP
jgi:hypothetical protein